MKQKILSILLFSVLSLTTTVQTQVQSMSCEKNIGEQLFHLGLKAIIQNKNGDILLVRRPNRETWDLPGGRMKPDELPLDGLRREIEEETGITELYDLQAYEIELTPIMVNPKHDGEKNVRLLVWYHTCRVSTDQIILSDEHVAFEWVPWSIARERMFPLGQSLWLDQIMVARQADTGSFTEKEM